MSGLTKRGTSYRVCWREDGAQRTQTFKLRREAQDFRAALGQRLKALKAVAPGVRVPWVELVDRWANLRAGRGVTAHYQAGARTALLAMGKEHGWADVGAVRLDHVERMGNYRRRLLRSLLRYASIYLDQPVAAKVLAHCRPTKVLRKDSPLLTEAAVADLVARAWKWSPGAGAIAHLIATYGHRAESVIGLRPVDLLPDDRLRLAVKSGDELLLPVLPSTMALLRPLADGRTPDAPFLVDHNGNPWASGLAFAGWWANAVSRRQKGSGILDLRRWATTRLYRGCKDAKTVADIQGRRTVALVLQTYARSDSTSQRAALDALALPNATK